MSAVGTSKDASIAWSKTCERLRAKVGGLPKNAGLFLFPSLESAFMEIGLLLTERDRELGGSKSLVPYGHLQDPALDLMAKVLSSSGLDTKPKSSEDLQAAATWFADAKSKLLLGAWAEDDRFTGAIHDTTALRAVFFADGLRVPVLVLNSGSQDWFATLPRSYEVRISEVSLGNGEFAVVAVAGERLRLEPRLAPFSLSESALSEIERILSDSVAAVQARGEVESFEASLPAPLTPWWPSGASRRLDRVIFGSSEHDGSWVVDQLRAPVIRSLVAKGVSESEAASRFGAGVFSLSGCSMGDERRQEWLRSRGDDAWKIRGTIHISLELVSQISSKVWHDVFQTELSSV